MSQEGPAWSKMLDELHNDIYKIVEPLSDEQVNWVHPQLTNSVGILLRHIAGSERYWIGEVVGGRPANRVRATEFVDEPLAKAPLVTDLRNAHASMRAILDELPLAGLAEEAVVTRGDERLSVSKAWVILHALTHIAYHLGQLQLFQKLAGADKGL